MQPLLKSIHHYATWHDHDFGPDHADRSFWNKEITKEAFKLFWARPTCGAGEQEGIHGFLMERCAVRPARQQLL